MNRLFINVRLNLTAVWIFTVIVSAAMHHRIKTGRSFCKDPVILRVGDSEVTSRQFTEAVFLRRILDGGTAQRKIEWIVLEEMLHENLTLGHQYGDSLRSEHQSKIGPDIRLLTNEKDGDRYFWSPESESLDDLLRKHYGHWDEIRIFGVVSVNTSERRTIRRIKEAFASGAGYEDLCSRQLRWRLYSNTVGFHKRSLFGRTSNEKWAKILYTEGIGQYRILKEGGYTHFIQILEKRKRKIKSYDSEKMNIFMCLASGRDRRRPIQFDHMFYTSQGGDASTDSVRNGSSKIPGEDHRQSSIYVDSVFFHEVGIPLRMIRDEIYDFYQGLDRVASRKIGILYEYWLGMKNDRKPLVSFQAAIQQVPTGSATLTEISSPIDWEDNYQSQMTGIINPPVDGLYTFWMSADDQAELWLEGEDSPDVVRLRIRTGNATEPYDWFAHAEQKSEPIFLKKGNQYHFYVLHAEFRLSDHVEVAWCLGDDYPVVIRKPFLSKVIKDEIH